MPDLLHALEVEVARFRAWADAYPIAQRSGEWECAYGDWQSLYNAFTNFVTATSCRDWSKATTQLLLYAIARDNEIGYLAQEVAKNSDNLICLAERVVTSPESNAKWQLAVELGHLGVGLSQVEPLLLQFAKDSDEYVRRRALFVLADMGSAHVTELVEPAWQTGNQYQRMAVLYALWKIGSPKLDTYLAQTEADGRQHLIDYAARVRAGNPE